MLQSPPNERRNFVHKRIIGGVGAFVSSGFSPTAALVGFARGGGGGGGGSRLSTADVHTAHGHIKDPRTGMRSGHGGGISRALVGTTPSDPCGFGMVFDPVTRKCVFGLGSQPGRDVAADEAVMGRYGAGLTPDREVRQTLTCLPGMVLGDDNICYNRGQVPNKRRKWPKGRKPLLTGGEMNAITTAARAARRVKSATSKLQALGMLAKPKSGGRKAPAAKTEVVVVGHHDHH